MTEAKIVIAAQQQPVFCVDDRKTSSADVVSHLLQKNHDNYHIFFKPSGLHNHIVHHLLTLYALGAPPDAIEEQFRDHSKSQRWKGDIDRSVVEQMRDPEVFQSHLGKEEQYANFLQFFEEEITQRGSEAVTTDYLLSGSAQADNFLSRCFGGFLHPLIHLGFALEFEQPAIVAEALAQTALHKDYLQPFFLEAERQATERSHENSSKPLNHLLSEIRQNKTLNIAAHWEDDNKIRDGILVRAPKEMINIASQWFVGAGDLGKKTAEMIDSTVYYTMGAQRATKLIKFDFYFIHCVNCSIFFTRFLKLPWISDQNKARLLEWKARNDLVMYASRRAPEIVARHHDYKPKHPGSWESLFARVADFQEDGHTCKLLRALANGQNACGPFQNGEGFKIESEEWLTFGHMVMDSVESPGKTWVRSAGFDEAWEDFDER